LPSYIVADAGYGSEQNYEDVLNNRQRTPLITYGMYRKEKKKSYKNNPFNISNWLFDQETDSFTCPNDKKLSFKYWSTRTDKSGFERNFKVYESEDCFECPLRSQCTKAKEGNNRKVHYNEKWENQKAYIQEVLSDEETGEIYGKRKIDVEPTFGFLKANLRFTRMSVRGKEQVKNEIGFALMAVNLRKYTGRQAYQTFLNKQNGANDRKAIISTVFYLIRDCFVPASF
jgi:hypothetical protein